MPPKILDILTRLLLLLVLFFPLASSRATPPNTLMGSVAICDPYYPQNCQAFSTALTDRTIASTSGVSQALMAANTARRGLLIQNSGNANCGINPYGGTAVIGGAGTMTLAAGATYAPPVATNSAINVICTAGQPIFAYEF